MNGDPTGARAEHDAARRSQDTSAAVCLENISGSAPRSGASIGIEGHGVPG